MDLRNCPKCGKLFAYNGSNKLCPVCRDTEEEKYQKVKDYLWDHPHATIEQVHEETGVERELIIKFVRDGRLISEGLDLDFMIDCERCGTPIVSGRFCAKCQKELISGFNSKEEVEEDDGEKSKKIRNQMFIAERIKKKADEKKNS